MNITKATVELIAFIGDMVRGDMTDARMAAMSGDSVWGEPQEVTDGDGTRWLWFGNRVVAKAPSEHLEDFIVLHSTAYAMMRLRALHAVLHEATKIDGSDARYRVLLALARTWEDCAAWNPDWDIPGGPSDPPHYEDAYQGAVERGMPRDFPTASVTAGGWL